MENISIPTEQIPKKKYNYKKRPGRPPREFTTNDLPKNWKQTILYCCAKGFSEEEVIYELCGTNLCRWEELQRNSKEFQTVYSFGRKLCESWWKEQGRKCLKKDTFQGYVWFKNMVNRFGWKDRQDIEHTLPESIIQKFSNFSVQELKKKADEILMRGLPKITTN